MRERPELIERDIERRGNPLDIRERGQSSSSQQTCDYVFRHSRGFRERTLVHALFPHDSPYTDPELLVPGFNIATRDRFPAGHVLVSVHMQPPVESEFCTSQNLTQRDVKLK